MCWARALFFGGDDGKGQVRDTISMVIDIVMEAKGNRGFPELLSSETHACVFQSMRAHNRVLWYFKLQAKLPDQAWQTLLNLLQRGKVGLANLLILIQKLALMRYSKGGGGSLLGPPIYETSCF